MTQSITNHNESGSSIAKTLEALRPKLHRYCARMAGSAIDGEDIVQDVLLKALEGLPGKEIASIESWLFRVAHNAAIDFLRRRRRQNAMQSDEDLDMIVDESSSAVDRSIAATALRSFMHLPVGQRACTILMDVLGYSLQDIAWITGLSIPAIKAALHRGRNRIRGLANATDDKPLVQLSQRELSRLASYVEHFNGRNFDAVRDMLAEDVRLDLVAKKKVDGRHEVSRYFHNYSASRDWHMFPGLVDGRAALLVRNPDKDISPPFYFVLLEWSDGKITSIRDFRHAQYVVESAETIRFGTVSESS